MSKYPTQYNEQRRDIRLIKIAQKQLGMDDDTYRDMLFALTRKRSSTALDFAERQKVLDHMKACGFKVESGKNAGKPANVKPELIPLMGKIGALLADQKLPWKYALAILERQAQVERLEWANAGQLHDVVAALAKRQGKLHGSLSPLTPPLSQGERESSRAEGEGAP